MKLMVNNILLSGKLREPVTRQIFKPHDGHKEDDDDGLFSHFGLLLTFFAFVHNHSADLWASRRDTVSAQFLGPCIKFTVNAGERPYAIF